MADDIVLNQIAAAKRLKAAYDREYRKKHRARRAKQQRARRIRDMAIPERRFKINEKQRMRRINKPDDVRAYDREYYKNNRKPKRDQANPKKPRKSRIEYLRDHRKKNREKLRKYQREWHRKKRNDLQQRIKDALRARLVSAIKRRTKKGSVIRDLGCSIIEFIAYIEDKFSPGMSWENWGPNTWHLDHIKPLSSFDLTNTEQFREAVHFTNYQPLWAPDNLRKSNKIVEP